MTGARHRTSDRAARTMPIGAVLGATVVGLAIVVGSVLALRGDREGASSASCSGVLPLNVTTSASLAGPLAKSAADFTAGKHGIGGRCVVVKIRTEASADVAATLARGGQGGTDTDAPPDVWVPESTDWLDLAKTQGSAAQQLPATAPTVASSPVVIAMPRPMANALGWPEKQLTWAQLASDENARVAFWAKSGHPDWGDFKFGLADPATSPTGLRTVVGVAASGQHEAIGDLSVASFLQDRSVQLTELALERGTAAVPTTDDALLTALRTADGGGKTLSFLSAFPMRESDLVAYNRGVGSPSGQPPKVTLAASYPTDGTVNDPVPYAVLKGAAADPARTEAASEFLGLLRGTDGQAVLTAAGFRTPTGASSGLSINVGAQPTLPKATTGAAGPVLASARSLFHSVHQRGSTLAVLDGSGSMSDLVPGNPPQTKLQIAIAACLQGVQLFALNDRVGLWMFSTGLPGATGFEQLSPVVPLNSKGRFGTHKDDLIQLQNTPVAGGDTPLYKVALASFRYQSQHYIAGRLNEVVLLTDGNNDDPEDPHDITLAALVQTLKKEYNPNKPVHVITIAFGANADRTALQQISQATNAHSYQSANPHDVLNVFINAVLQAAE